MLNIKRKLKPYYDKDRFMKIEDFILFEMAVMVVLYFKRDADPNKGYIMFTKYQNIGKRECSEDSFLLQNASICLKRYRSEKIWKDTLKLYRSDAYAGIRLYDIVDDKFVKKDTGNLSYPNREEDYFRYFQTCSRLKTREYATRGAYRYYNRNNDEKNIHIMLNENVKRKITETQSEILPREKITLTMEQLLKSAEEMQKILPGDPCFHILQKNMIKEVDHGNLHLAEKLELDKVVNIVGMVGAGKTTLLKVISYSLDKLGKREVIVTDTVAEVFHLYKYFHSLGCHCSPLIGKSERVKYINQMIEDEYYLEEEVSCYLTTNCLIDGLDLANENAVSFGEEPCTRLEQERKTYICPHFEQCQTTAMQREALKSNIVITTVAGLVMSRIGPLRKLFLQEVLEHSDVVFYDECDRVQKNLDDLFTPATEFNEFIRESADEYRQFMLESNAKRMENFASLYYAELQSKSPIVLACVSNAVKLVKSRGKKQLLADTFSAYSLLDDIQESISTRLYNEIYKLMDPDRAESSALYHIMMSSCESTKTERFEWSLDAWLDQNEPDLVMEDVEKVVKAYRDKSENELKTIRKEVQRHNQERIDLRKKIQLILTLIFFDSFVLEIGNAYEATQDITMEHNELVGFIRTRFTEQQDYLPSALMGNLFGLKTTADDDLLLFRQYAYGRSLLTELPYLRVNCDGTAIGPHVVLLSGSSYAKGSFAYHVNAEVNYIVEADQNVRDFIARTRFVELGIEERVSGSPLEQRENILKKVVDRCAPNIVAELKKPGKILLVVNSFSQVEVVADHLRRYLQKLGSKEGVCALLSDRSDRKGDLSNFIRRGEVYRFAGRKERILVAPALAIERGHNIVDEYGHSSLSSVFFLIRPMGVPDDVKEKSIKMNGYIAAKMFEYEGTDLYDKNIYVRREAAKFWSRMNFSSKRRLDHLNDSAIKTDLVATMFVLILQIFGRLCRVTDAEKNPPTVYFADGAFRKQAEDGFDTLNELYRYLENLLLDAEGGEIAKTLYEPFFIAYEGGIRYE